jgi:serine kinase of HPr protein (carbohydrate metabolism regulator)
MIAGRSRLHASCVAIDGAGILIRGPSGSGKSSLALRLIDEGGVLVADDQTVVEAADDGIVASAPASIAGRLEVRGLGIVRVEHLPRAKLALIVDLAAADAIARLPEPAELTARLCGRPIDRLSIDPGRADATARLRLALRLLRERSANPAGPLVSLTER